MGLFTQPQNRRPYAPSPGSDDPAAATANRTLLGGNDPNLIRVADGPAAAAPEEDVQIAQQQPTTPAQRRPAAPSQPAAALPGRGYGVVPQAQIERGMTTAQKMINRSQALREFASQPPPANADLLPDDWQATKPRDLVDDIRRASQRHGVPLQMLARMLYQEGKFNEPGKIDPKHPIVWSSDNPTRPIGEAQITMQTLQELKNQAAARRDTARAKELDGYSLANREQAFDAAAERLAYSRRMLGSWHAAVAAYNMSPEYFDRWLKGQDPVGNFEAPEVLSNNPNDKRPSEKWREILNHLRIAVRGAPEQLQMPDMYETGNIRTGVKVAPWLPPRYPKAISGDTKNNP